MKNIQSKAIDASAHLHSLYVIAALFIFCLTIFSACTPNQLGLATPQTTEDKLYAAYSAVGASYKTIADLARRKVITQGQGVAYIYRTDKAKESLDVANRFIAFGDQDGAQKQVEAALSLLMSLEKDLKAKEVK